MTELEIDPYKLSEDQKRTKVQLAVSLQTEFERAQRRNRTEFYTSDDSTGKGKNFQKGCWLSLDEELQNGFVKRSWPRNQCC
jgi:hypothetical protein